MGKIKANNPAASVPNKALYSRITYLHQAATYLATQSEQTTAESIGVNCAEPNPQHHNTEHVAPLFVPRGPAKTASLSASRHLLSDLRAVSLKVQIRLSTAVKHSICKRCDTPLQDGTTCKVEIENKSKGGKKPWADVLVRKCILCGLERRYPLAERRQKRRPLRTVVSPSDDEHTVTTGA